MRQEFQIRLQFRNCPVQPGGTTKGLLHDIHLGTSAAARQTGPVFACVAVTLDVAYHVIKGQQTCHKAIRLLAEACVELMYLILSADHDRVCTASAMKEFAEGRLRSDLTDVQELVNRVTQASDHTFYSRLLVLDGVQQRLEHYKGTFQKAACMLQLDVGPCAFATAARQAREGIKQDVRHLLLAHPECRGVEDLARHGQGSRELAGMVGVLDNSVLKALVMALDQGSYALLKNKSIRQLWMQHFPDSEQVPWDSFWGVFPSCLEEDKEELEAYFKDKRQQKIFQCAATLTDHDAVDIVELNSIFRDNSSLVEQVKSKIAEYEKNHGAVNQASQVLMRIPPDLTRPELGKLAELLQQKRLVSLQGAPGEGKYIAACQAGCALLRPSSTQEPSSGKHFQATFCCDMATGKSRDEIDSRLRSCFESVPRSGPRDDQFWAALNSIIEKDTEKTPFKALLILNNVDEVPDGAVLNDFCTRLHSILFRSTSSGLQPTNFTIVMSSRTEQSRITDWSEAFASEAADFRLRALPPDTAGKLFIAEMERCGNAQKVHVSPRDARKLAANHCCNPTLLKVLASSIETPAHLRVALRAPLRQAMNRMEAFWDMLRACLGRLSTGALSTLLLLVEVTPSAFTHEILVKVLTGWYGDTEEDELECAVHGDIREMHAHNFIQLGEGGVYSVVPVIQDCVKYFKQHPPDQTWQGHVSRVSSALPMIYKNYIGSAVGMLEASFQTSIHTFRAAYVEKSMNKQLIQNALLLATSYRLEQTPEVVEKALGLLSLVVYDTLLYDLMLVQDSCLQLVHQHAGNNYIVGLSLSSASAFFRYGKDEIYGFIPSLTHASKALEMLSTCSGSGAAFAKVVALRSKGLILREQGEQGRAVACHKEALELLRPLRGQRAHLETVLNLAELSGTLDYMGACAEGIQAGQQALDLAQSLFVEGSKPAKHPATALALGALGFNLLNSGRAEEALDVHRQAYEMRSYVCGERHPETAMSIQQIGLCYQRLGMFAEAESSLRRSLEVRAHLPRTYAMINLLGNTQVQLAKLYMNHGAECAQKQSLAVHFLRLAVETRLEILEPRHRKVQEPLAELVMLLLTTGQRAEAERVDQWAKILIVQATIQRTKSLQPELEGVQVSSRLVLGLQTAFREELSDAVEAGAQEAHAEIGLLQSVPGAPAPELVLGREAETQAALGLLGQGLGVMLVGGCGVGKSTLIRHVLRQLGTPAATVSLATATSAEAVLSALCGSLGIKVVVEEEERTRTLSEAEATERLLEKVCLLTQSQDPLASPKAFVLEACEVPLAHAESRAVLQRLMEKLQHSQLPSSLLLEANKDLGEHALPLPGVAELRVDTLDSVSAQALACAAYGPTGLEPQPEEAQQICAACEGNPLKICLLAASFGSGKARLQDVLELARRPSCYSDLLAGFLSEHLGDMLQLSWFGSTFTTEEAAALMGISDRSATLKLQELRACWLVLNMHTGSWFVPSALREAAKQAASKQASGRAQAQHAALRALQLVSFSSEQLADWLPSQYVDVLSALAAASCCQESHAAFQGQLLSMELEGLKENLACVGLEPFVLKVIPKILGPPAPRPVSVDAPAHNQPSYSSLTARTRSQAQEAGVASPSAPTFQESCDAGTCVVCHERPKEWGALHGSSVHALLCGACYENPLMDPHKQRCSICLQAVSGFVRLYNM